jgi:DNA-binding transcriptional regulator GbsR (MarR family)
MDKIVIVNPSTFFTTKELCHYKNIDKFFKECHEKHPEILTTMINIIEGQSCISLRILDWVVTKYSKKRISLGVSKSAEVFDIRISYKAQLKGYKKRYFDPFRRKKKFFYPCTEDGYKMESGETKHIWTTLGQLNFFRWAFNNEIIKYVDNNLHQIITEMNNYNKDEKKKKLTMKETEKKTSSSSGKSSKEEKNGKLKINAVKTTSMDEIKLTLTFD